MKQDNEKPRQNRGLSKENLCGPNQSQTEEPVKFHLETRRNAGSCYRTQKNTEPHYCGIMVVEGLRDGDKVWINIGVRVVKSGKRAGQKYLSVTLLPFKPCGGRK